MEAKEFLEQIKKIDKMIKNKRFEREQCLNDAMNMTSGGKGVWVKLPKGKYEWQNMEKVQSSGRKDPMGDAVSEAIDNMDEITAEIVGLEQEKKEIIKVIEQLPVDQYAVLHLIYVQGFTLKAAAIEEGRGYNWAKNNNKKGIASVQKILDEQEGKENEIIQESR